MTVRTLVETPEYKIVGEFFPEGLSMHGDVCVPWTKGLRRKILRDFEIIKRSYPGVVFAMHSESLGKTQRHFITTMGGVFDHHNVFEGEPVEVYRFPLDSPKHI